MKVRFTLNIDHFTNPYNLQLSITKGLKDTSNENLTIVITSREATIFVTYK